MQWYSYILIGLAAMAAGLINALAGGGTLISFPMLTAVGIPPIAANVTSTVALVPGYLGATLAQWKDIKDQKRRLWFYVPAGLVGGVLGGYLLLLSGEKLFSSLVPYLILFAAILLALSDQIRALLLKRLGKNAATADLTLLGLVPVGLAAIYGGYFGAGVSVIILAVLGLVINDSLTRLNALKQAISFSANIAAATFFVFSGKVRWDAWAVMAVCALVGGSLGGRLAGKIKPGTLRLIVVVIGITVAIIYIIKG